VKRRTVAGMHERSPSDLRFVVLAIVIHTAIIIAAMWRPFSFTESGGFWLFSTIAQSIAALFGFIFAGYAFFRSETDLDDADDPEADEISRRMHAMAHNRLINASIPAAVSIIGGLSMVVLIKEQVIPVIGNISGFSVILGTVTFYEAIFAVLASIGFVVHLVNPNRIRGTVEDILEEESMAGEDVAIGEFLEDFVQFENMLREVYYHFGGSDETPTAGKMFNYLKGNDEYQIRDPEKLQRVIRFRNLAAHGQIESVDRQVMEDLQELISEMNDRSDDLQR